MNISTRILMAGVLTCIGAVSFAQPVEVQDAFRSALRNGYYKGELKGQMVDSFRRQYKTAASLFIDVESIHEFKQAGCRRLQGTFTAPDFKYKDGTGMDRFFHFQMQMNLCPDGNPPSNETYVQPAGSRQISLDDALRQRDEQAKGKK